MIRADEVVVGQKVHSKCPFKGITKEYRVEHVIEVDGLVGLGLMGLFGAWDDMPSWTLDPDQMVEVAG